MNSQLTFIHALSPLHAGTGQGAGVIDLPIAREKATGLPFLPGSSLKGTLRAALPEDKRARLYGPDTSAISPEENYASSVQFSDQRLLLLPVRSLVGTFAWITCPYVLRRLLRDIADIQMQGPNASIPEVTDLARCAVAEEKSKIGVSQVYLEDLDLHATPDPNVTRWAEWIGKRVFPDKEWQTLLLERICVVHDDVFSFLINTATEITTRIKLQEKAKTVQDGGLWYEEALPAETILSGTAIFNPTTRSGVKAEEAYKTIQDQAKKILQLGGKATVGRGLCRLSLTQEGM